MSYQEEKRRRNLTLIHAIHGGGAGDDEPGTAAGFDGGARPDPIPEPGPGMAALIRQRQGIQGPFPSGEPGWPVEYELEDGAGLLLPPELLGD